MFRSAVALLALAALFSACGRSSPPASERPQNVVLFVVDTLRADRLGAYGYPRSTSPFFDRVAARGTTYTENRTQAPWTAPSMISMLTGLYVTDEEQLVPENRPVLAEWIQEAGFATGGFTANGVLSAERGFDRGFDHFWSRPVGDGNHVIDAFLPWFESVAPGPDQERGFFAWIHLVDPHDPYKARETYEQQPLERVDQAEIEARWAAAQPRVAGLSPNRESWSYERARFSMTDVSRRYDSEVAAADACLGRVLTALRERGLLEDTLLILASDHGELLYEYEHYPLELSLRLERENGLEKGVVGMFAFGHRAWYFPELWRTPLILAGPGFPAGARVDGLAGNLDIVPTLVSLLGLDATADFPGQDLTGGARPEREQLFAHGWETSAVIERSGLQLIEHNRLRFLADEDQPKPLELFDHQLPERPYRELSAERPAQAERLLGDLAAWRERHQRPGTRSDMSVLSDDAIDVLKEMGYVDEGMLELDEGQTDEQGSADGSTEGSE